MKPSLQLKLTQSLTMTPQLQQAIKMLQLNVLELQQSIQESLDTNPMLEVEESQDDEHLEQELPWHQSSQMQSRKSSSDDFDWSTLLTAPRTLQTHLEEQLNLAKLTPLSHDIGIGIIDSIDAKGRLTESLPSLASNLTQQLSQPITQEDVEVVLKTVQGFDPLGVGARSLSECLCLQLNTLYASAPWLGVARVMVQQYLPQVAKRDWAALKRYLRLDSQALADIIRVVQSLAPYPGELFQTEDTDYVVPDVYVLERNGQFDVALNPEVLPNLAINQHYAGLIKRADSSRDNLFLKNQLQEARWFVKSLQTRNETLLKVATAIMRYQSAFLTQGEEAMRPLVLSDIAEEVALHESTISRVTTNKYIHTPRGTFELKYFFSSQLSEGHTAISATSIKAKIKTIITNEDKQKPFSDSKIAEILKESGIPVARRTVAKYREAMNIPATSIRKALIKSLS